LWIDQIDDCGLLIDWLVARITRQSAIDNRRFKNPQSPIGNPQ